MSDSIFSKLETECKKDKLIKELREQVQLLEQENNLLKEKEVERTKLNPEAECVCIYANNMGTYVYGEEEQLEKMLLNKRGLKYTCSSGAWGKSLQFNSIASAKTFLLINGYKYSYTSQTYYNNTICLYVENWIRGV